MENHLGQMYLLLLKGTKSPYYIMLFIVLIQKMVSLKGSQLYANGNYITWIGLWTTEKKFSFDVVQDFNQKQL